MKIIADNKTIDKIFENIMNTDVRFDAASPADILFGDAAPTINDVIREAELAVVDEKIAALKADYRALASKVYKSSDKTVNVGDALNGDTMSVNTINSRRRARILANIVANIEDLEDERKAI